MPRSRKRPRKEMNTVPLLVVIVVSLVIGGLVGYASGQVSGVSHDWPEILNVLVSTSQIEDDAVTNPKIADSAVSKPKLSINSVDGSKIQDGTVTAVDVFQGQVCVTDAGGNPSMGCPTAPELGCESVFSYEPLTLGATPEKAVDVPKNCINGQCTIVVTVRLGATTPYYGIGRYTQTSAPEGGGPNEKWFMFKDLEGSSIFGGGVIDPADFLEGTNGLGGATAMFSPLSSGIFILYDDFGSESDPQQWYARLTNSQYTARVIAC